MVASKSRTEVARGGARCCQVELVAVDAAAFRSTTASLHAAPGGLDMVDRKPWVLVEVKTRDTSISDSLRYCQAATRASHAFQAVMELPYVDVDCFSRFDPTVVPPRTLLSQLL